MAAISGITGWFLNKWNVSGKLNDMFDRGIIADLERIREIMTRWEELQDSDTGMVDMLNLSPKDKDLDDMFSLLQKHREDWVSIDKSTPTNQRAKRIRQEANKSIDSIRTHGHKQAKKMRQEELRNSDKKPWPWVDS